jgi:protein-tyrosine-phosphatase
MAEGLLRKLMRERGVPGEVSSAGLFTVDGLPASFYSIEVMKEWGVDLSGHRSRQVTLSLIEQADHVVGITSRHVESLLLQFPEQQPRICTFPLPDIPDPYGSSLESYRAIRDLLHEWSRSLVDHLLESVQR